MATRKIYYNESDLSKNMAELEMYQNDKEELFIDLTHPETDEAQFVSLSKEDAIKLISELAFQFDLIDDELASPKMIWNGKNRAGV